MRGGCRLWWRGMKVAWRSRWLFWLIPALWAPSLALQAVSLLADGERVRPFPPAHLTAGTRWAPGLTLAQLAGTVARVAARVPGAFDSAFHLPAGLFPVALMAVFVGVTWRSLGGKRRRLLKVAVSAVVLLALLGMAGPKRAVGEQLVWRLWTRYLWSATVATVTCAGFGRLFLAQVRGRRLDWRVAQAGALFRFCPLFLYFLLFSLPYFLTFSQSPLDLSPGPQLWTSSEPGQAAIGFVNLLTVPVPLLLVVGGGGLGRALAAMVSLYRKRWKEVVGLQVATVVPMLFLTTFVWGVWANEPAVAPLTTLVFVPALGLARVLLSLGGITGMYLLIEEWRRGIRSGSPRGLACAPAGLAGRDSPRPDEAGRGTCPGRPQGAPTDEGGHQ